MVGNGDLDWLVKGPASDDQKLAAFDQWLGHNTANSAIVPAIQDYLVEHRQEIDQEVKDHQLTLDNVTDDSAERYVDKYNERFIELASHYGLLAAPYDETNYYTREVKTNLWLKDRSLRETDDRIIVADFDEIMNADANGTLDRLAMKKMVEATRAIESSAEYNQDKEEIDERYKEIARKIEHDLKKQRKVISYDMETTGFDPQNDDILQLSIVDGDGNELFNKLFKPTKKNEWPEAAAVNGITPERVQDYPAFQAWTGQVQEIFDQADVVVGYNQRNFDDRFLKANGIKIDPAKENHDLMLEFAEAVGEPNPYLKGFNKTPYKWQKLGQAADFYDYDWGNEHAHDSLADARATAYVYRQMNPEWPVQPKEMAKQYLNYLHHAYPNYENAPAGISNSLSMLRDMSDYLYYEQRTPQYTPRQLQSMVRQGLEELKRQEERTQEIIYHDERVEAVKKLTLTDDASDRGGKAYADETAGDFMQTAFGNRADVDFKELNQALKESGIKPLAEPLAQQKIERAAKVLAKNYAQDQTSMAVAEYLQNTKRPMAQRLKVANNIIAARRPHGKPISNSKKQTKEH